MNAPSLLPEVYTKIGSECSKEEALEPPKKIINWAFIMLYSFRIDI